MKKARINYKQAIRIMKAQGDCYVSNELNDLLLSKDLTGFWPKWNSKIGNSKMTPVIDDQTDHAGIAQKFANMFRNSCSTQSCNVSGIRQSIFVHRIARIM